MFLNGSYHGLVASVRWIMRRREAIVLVAGTTLLFQLLYARNRPGGHAGSGSSCYTPRMIRKGNFVRPLCHLGEPRQCQHKRITSLLAAAAPDFGVEIVSATGREPAEIETAMSRWGQGLGHGVILPSDPATNSRRGLIIELAARYRLPTIYSLRSAVVDGGLMSYGVDIVELFRHDAFYADRIVKGEKPAELPVQPPTKFELVANLNTAKAQGFDIPPSLLSTADEVIEWPILWALSVLGNLAESLGRWLMSSFDPHGHRAAGFSVISSAATIPSS
jgi:hypothetical protein